MAQKNSGKNPTPKINYNILRSSAVLLFMEYKPSELARELRIHTKTILRSYIPTGFPHRRDPNGNIWIVGTAFDEWARSIHHQKAFVKKTRLRDDQAYCVKCRRVIDYQTILRRRSLSAGRIMLFVPCPHCGITIARFLKGGSHD